MKTPTRPCEACSSPLPEAARKDRRFCSETCRNRAAQQRRRAATRDRPTLADQLAAARKRIAKLETQLGQTRARLGKRDDRQRNERRSARRQLKHARRALDWESASSAQERILLRDQLTDVTARLTAAMTGQVDRSYLEVAAKQIVGLQRRAAHARQEIDRLTGQLSAVTAKYDRALTDLQRLHTTAQQLAGQVKDMAGDRQRYRMVLLQWDELAGRLARSVDRRTISPKDRRILEHWLRWKKAHPTGQQRADRPVTGQRDRGQKGSRQ